MTTRPRRRCRTCGRNCHSRHGLCQECRTDIPLRGGRWVLGPRRVLVWESATRMTTTTQAAQAATETEETL
jgi:hypothetical protein